MLLILYTLWRSRKVYILRSFLLVIKTTKSGLIESSMTLKKQQKLCSMYGKKTTTGFPFIVYTSNSMWMS